MPLQVEEDSSEESEAWVTAVEPEYEQEQTSQYAGYMRIPLPWLPRLACLGDVVPCLKCVIVWQPLEFRNYEMQARKIAP